MIHIKNTATGWQALFDRVPDMPREWLPLPFTVLIPAQTVIDDLRARFPKAKINYHGRIF